MTKQSTKLWRTVVLPRVAKLKTYITPAQLLALRMDVQGDLTQPDEVLDVLDTLHHLYRMTERLH